MKLDDRIARLLTSTADEGTYLLAQIVADLAQEVERLRERLDVLTEPAA